MTIKPRDKRALSLLGIAAVVWVILHFALSGPAQPKVSGISDSIPVAEKRLERLRRLAASVPGKEEVVRRVSAELESRERGIIQVETAAQAQAQMLETLRRLAKAQSEPLDLRNLEPRQIRPFGDDYGEVFVSATFECHIEQLVQLLADITAEPQLIAVNELRVNAHNQKEKKVLARLTVSGVVPRKLVPERKGFATF